MSPTSEAPEKRHNRLAQEKSPYLLQHAHNPVDWYPWGEEAFAKARQDDRPIFLSVGYSTCHWCHVMERESFESESIAALLNEHFVCIKVDREERPDVDRVYMTTVQALTGSGGWPLSVWLTPELKPFYGGTYFPPDSRYGRPGFPDVLRQLSQAWTQDRERIVESGEKIIEGLRTSLSSSASEEAPLDRDTADKILRRGYSQFYASYDVRLGGFGSEPKFPRPVVLTFLNRFHLRSGETSALDMGLRTLERMWAGGMYDHLGGGFHRYSVDAYWRVPHFEKMLYDQAQLIWAYLEAFQLSQNPLFAEIARQTLDYVLRDLNHPEGGFYSAEDADSARHGESPEDKVEGAFYLWEKEEIEGLLPEQEAEVFNLVYGVSRTGNTLSDPQGEFGTGNVLYAAASPAQAAQQLKLDEAEVERMLERSRQELLARRLERPRPHLDDKIITAWNGLMVSACARAHQVLGDDRYRVAAERGASFVLKHNRDPKGDTLYRRFRDGEAKHPAHLDDFAFLTLGLLDLYESSLDIRWLEHAVALTETQNRLFWDEEQGGFFDSSGEDASILLRTKESYDGAEPSGSSIAILNLLRLSQMLERSDWRGLAEGALASVAGRLEQAAHTMPQMLTAVDFASSPIRQIVLAGPAQSPATERLLRPVHEKFLPNRVLLLADGAEGQAYLGSAVPFLESLSVKEGEATAYVCEGFACQLPTQDVDTLIELLEEEKTQKR